MSTITTRAARSRRSPRALGATYHCDAVDDLAKLAPDIVIECTGVPAVIAALLPQVAPDGVDLPHRRRRARTAAEFDIGLFNRNMVLNNGTVFGTVNANLRHYQMAADALARADRAWLVTADHAPRAARALCRGVRAPQGRHQGRDRVRVHEPDASRIEDYALIGDCESAALVGARRLDRLAVLAALRFRCLLRGAARRRSEHGRFRIAPRGRDHARSRAAIGPTR